MSTTWYYANKERAQAAHRLWIEKNREYTREYARERLKDPEIRKRKVETTKIWRKNNPDKMLLVNKRTRERVKQRRILYQRLKSITPCADCGKTYPHYVMDYHHMRGEKFKPVGQMIASYSKKRIEDEISKCDLLCSNCHRIRTWKGKTLSE